MVCFTVTLGVIVLCGFISLPAAKDTCDLYAAVGQSLTLPFVYDELTALDTVRWTHNYTTIFYRDWDSVSVGDSMDISATGSLLLKNLQFSDAGTYKATVWSFLGRKTWTRRLCMMDKVSKPVLTYTCDSSAVNLNCYVANPQGLVFSWTLDEIAFTNETKQKLSVSLAQLKGQRNFTCSVANKASEEKSDTVRPTCKRPSPPTLLCFQSKTVAAVVAGGAGLNLLSLIVIIVLCCYRRSKRKTCLGDDRELRMDSSISLEYEIMHPIQSSPPLSLEPRERVPNTKTPNV